MSVEILFVLMLALGAFAAGPILAIVALVQSRGLRARVETLERQLQRMGSPPAERRKTPERVPVPATLPRPASPVPPADPAPPPPTAPATGAPAPPAPMPSPAPTGQAPPRDIATNLGPKIMAAAAALFVVASLAFFVKYAWDNNWVGPTGRILGSAFFSIVLVAVGLRALGRQYRPLGQALVAAGLAGLYVSSFGAHAFYALVPRAVALALMVAVTTSAVLLAIRLQARLLSLLAWTGAYLAPVLLSTGEDRGGALFAYLAVLAVGALAVDLRTRWNETLPLALAGTTLLFLAWYGQHYGPARWAVAAPAAIGFCALFALGPRRRLPWLTAAALLLGGLSLLCFIDRGALHLGLPLLAFGAIGAAASGAFPGSILLGLAASVLATGAFVAQAPRPTHGGLGLAACVFLFYLATLLAQRDGAASDDPLVRTVHLGNAFAYWVFLYVLLTESWKLAAASVALGALYLALGLGQRGSPARSRLLLGVAASFLTVAIPVHFGVNGITVAWAAEGILLLALGVWARSDLARAGGFLVLGLAVLRLFARHLPLHDGPFTPLLNSSFGVWLFVLLALVAATRFVPERNFRGAMSAASLGLLFLALTLETDASFGQLETTAFAARDAAAASDASLLGGLSISLLWGLFASGLLVAGLSLRNRPTFYAAYALFAITAAKVALLDLSSLRTIYRIVSFFALGVLLMLGAFLIMRFRDRMLPPSEEA